MQANIETASETCDGLLRLIRKLNGAAVDLDQSGGSAHEMFALLAVTNQCVTNLSMQLHSISDGNDSANVTTPATNVSTLKPNTGQSKGDIEQHQQNIKIAASG